MWTAVLYPFLTAFGYPDNFTDFKWILIIFGDFIMGVDIIFTFFLAYADEGSMTYVTDFSKIANRYIFESDFVLDFIILLPLS